MAPALRAVLVFPLVASSLALAQLPPMPGAAPRFVDFHRDLARPDVVVVVGTLGKGKEGKRERLPDGQLGGSGAVTSVSGTQYFKVPVQATVQPRATFEGKADKVVLAYDVQLARLPDGNEKRQSTTGTAAPMNEGMLALFVVVPLAKGKGFGLLDVLPFDKEKDKGPDAEALFVDSMRDHFVMNRRMLDLENALANHDKAKTDADKQAARTRLRELVDEPLELRRPENDGLRTMHVAPFENRARQILAKAQETPAADK